jgi:hypothetical protein
VFRLLLFKSTDGNCNGPSGDGSARATTENHKVKFLDINFPDCLICSSGFEIRHATLSIEINVAGFSTAGQSVQFRSRAKLAIT